MKEVETVKNSGLPLICKMIKILMPAVRRELEGWRRLAERIPDPELRAQALASIEKKRFHCLGGGVFALYPNSDFNSAVRFIVAFQTISDYLDNLCDRAGVLDEDAFMQLHLAMADALDPGMPMRDYYLLYPHKNDGGYLTGLVQACREQVEKLPRYETVAQAMRRMVSLYSHLQAHKHIRPDLREGRLEAWAEPLAREYPGISVWEFCAATGSTLAVFLLFTAARDGGFGEREADALLDAYFPWVCALHILLDYFIDAEEDRVGGDFNFTAYYGDAAECADRLSFLTERAMRACAGLKYAGFHRTVVRGLLAMYLSDPKAGAQNKSTRRELLRRGGKTAAIYCELCKTLRIWGKI